MKRILFIALLLTLTLTLTACRGTDPNSATQANEPTPNIAPTLAPPTATSIPVMWDYFILGSGLQDIEEDQI